MREILFRGADSYNGGWVYGDLIQYKDYSAIKCRETGLEISVIKESIGQYIGATFKGQKVFEGDVFFEKLEGTSAKVIYDEDLSCFMGDKNEIEVLNKEVVSWDYIKTPEFCPVTN